MKLITVRIDEDQYEKLQTMAKSFRMRGISCLIRRAIDIYLRSFPYVDIHIKDSKILEERRTRNEYDEHFQ